MVTEVNESRDAAPTAMKHDDEKMSASPPPPPAADGAEVASPTQLKKNSSHHKRRHTTGGPHSPTTRNIHEGYPSPQSHSRIQPVGSPYRNSPTLIPHGPPPLSPPLGLSPYSPHVGHLPPTHGLAAPFLVNPVQPHPPRISKIQKAMEAAIITEHTRMREMEAKEKDLGADELRVILKQERHRMAKFAADLAKHKMLTVQSQLESEIMEEGRVNGLMRRLEELQLEKGRIVFELEREEEMLTNALQKKLDQVRLEKLQLEKLLRDEQKSHSAASTVETKMPDLLES